MLWASIILPMTPPVLLAVASSSMRLVDRQRQHAVVDQPVGGDRLQAAEQGVGRRVRAGQGHAEPAEQGREERIDQPVRVKARPSVASMPL